MRSGETMNISDPSPDTVWSWAAWIIAFPFIMLGRAVLWHYKGMKAQLNENTQDIKEVSKKLDYLLGYIDSTLNRRVDQNGWDGIERRTNGNDRAR